MNVKVIPAKNPYKPTFGDLVCGFDNPESKKYLETPMPVPEGQVLPLCLVHPNCWLACEYLGIDVEAIKTPYQCPYTDYTFYSIVPVAIVSKDLNKNWGEIVRKSRCGNEEYVLDHEYHRSMWKAKVFMIQNIGKLMLGSGYTSCTSIWDGSRSEKQTIVNLDNGDGLWVSFWEWYNK